MVHKTIKYFSIVVVLFLSVNLSSCYYDNLEELTGVVTCDTANITYANFVQTTMTTNCTACHSGTSASAGIDLSSYNAVSTAATNANFMGSMNHLSAYSAMPQGGSKLDACTLNKLQAWINAGKPQ